MPPKPFILNEKGFTLKQKGQFEKALEAYNEAIRLSPDFFPAWFNKGVSLSKLGRNEEATEAFTQALRIDPNDSDAWANKGATLVKLDRYECVFHGILPLIPQESCHPIHRKVATPQRSGATRICLWVT